MKTFAKIQNNSQILWVQVHDQDYYPLKTSIYDKSLQVSDTPIESVDTQLLPPCDAGKVIGLAYNYKSLVGKKDHYDEPLFFFKSPTSLVGHNGVVVYPSFADVVWHEVELAIVIGRECKNVSVQEASSYILGYTCGNDITCENINGRDWHLARSKGLDTFCPLGPYLVTGIDTDNLAVRSYINSRLTQESTTADRILSDTETVSLISQYLTLMPGDVILTGTPAGAREARIASGDTISVEIENIGILTNYVKAL